MAVVVKASVGSPRSDAKRKIQGSTSPRRCTAPGRARRARQKKRWRYLLRHARSIGARCSWLVARRSGRARAMAAPGFPPGFGAPVSGTGKIAYPKHFCRKTVDYSACTVRMLKERTLCPEREASPYTLDASPDAAVEMLPPNGTLSNAAASACTRFVHSALNKDRSSVNAGCWMPDGRRLITASYNGMFTLWSGFSFNFEATQQARREDASAAARRSLGHISRRAPPSTRRTTSPYSRSAGRAEACGCSQATGTRDWAEVHPRFAEIRRVAAVG